MLKHLLALVFLIDSIVLLDDCGLLFESIFGGPSRFDSYPKSYPDLPGRLDAAGYLDRDPDHIAYHRHLIDCAEFRQNVTLLRKIAEGAVKEVWLGKWSSNGYIAVSFLKNRLYSDDFQHNIHMLRNFTLRFRSKYTAHFLGECDGRLLFTKFYRLGPLNGLYHLLPRLVSPSNRGDQKVNQKVDPQINTRPNEAKDCFQFCISYARVIDYLHHSPIGRRVMCDSNDLTKLASQFLIDDDLSIVVNDLDALPDATDHPIKCGNRSLYGDLIAPEQRSPQATYDHRIDIYKLPFVCNYIRSLCPKNELLELLLTPLHAQCLDQLPSNRPDSSEIIAEYLKINYTLFSN